MKGGVLDLPAPLLDLVDAALGALWLPAALRVAIYGALLGAAGLLIYARFSRQARLRELGEKQLALQQQVILHEGGFGDLVDLVSDLMVVSKERFLLTIGPALLASAPMLFVLPWLSNRFEAPVIAPGTEVCAHALISNNPYDYEWRGDRVVWDDQRFCWRLHWPAPEAPLVLLRDSVEITRLPWPAPARAVYRKSGWELVTANPAGDLPEDSPIDSLELDVPARELIPFGPRALRGWLAVFFLSAIVASLWLKFRRNVA